MADTTFGVKVEFATSNFTAELTDVQLPTIERESFETTHHESDAGTSFTGAAPKTYIPSDLLETGELTLTIWFDKDTKPPIDVCLPEDVTITFPLQCDETGYTAATWAFKGFMTSYAPGGMPLEGLHEGTVTVKVTGDITITPAASP